MSHTPSHWFPDCISALSLSRNQRVWSIIVSLFGDMARHPEDRISGPVMSRIIEPIGIKPEATRVALHRLRNDGWIASEKQGRTSFYWLTPSGLTQTAAASPRIYARTTANVDSWHLVVLQPQSTAQRAAVEKPFLSQDYLLLAPGVFLGKGQPLKDTADAFIITGQPERIPNWLKQQIASPWQKHYQDLAIALTKVSRLLDQHGHIISPTQSATLRTLIVHNWRRTLLNHGDLPPMFYPGDWQGFICRDLVMDLLDRLQRPDLALLNNAI